MTHPQISTYARHSAWTAPGPHAALLDALPADPEALPDALAGLLLHPALAGQRGLPIPPRAEGDLDLRKAREMLETLSARDARPLRAAREPQDRLFVVCRHYALFAASVLRAKGVPARLRVGFADYFTPGQWEDHWVCEYFDGAAWRLLDAELGEEARRDYAVDFPAHDVPRGGFRPAAELWRAIRAGRLDEALVGLPGFGLAGAWFAAGNMLRDAAALAMIEVQPWDCWGPAVGFGPQAGVPGEWLGPLDRLAEALVREPAGLDQAQAVHAEHAWAAPGPTVVSQPLNRPGPPVEVSLA